MNINDYTAERGHSIKPDATTLAVVPPLYATDGVRAEDKIVFAHYFAGSCNWYLMELDQDEWLAFGWCDLGQGYPELGYFSLHELASIKAEGRVCYVEGGRTVREGTMPIYVERDLHWTAARFGDLQLDR